jgi:hypothetical protein
LHELKMAPIEAIGDAEQGGELLDEFTAGRVEGGEPSVSFAGW